jgi:hypothetical protein
LRVFTDPSTGFSTSDVRDAQDQIVQFTSRGDLIWGADGTRFPGYVVTYENYIPCGPCDGWFEVRFGTQAGERRAYLTVDYGHDNPGTLVDLEVAGGALVVNRTSVFPPGTYTLSGVVSEITPSGPLPVADAHVYRGYGSGWQSASTDANGFYEIHGLYDRMDTVAVAKDGYNNHETRVEVAGNTRFDVLLSRVSTAGVGPGSR